VKQYRVKPASLMAAPCPQTQLELLRILEFCRMMGAKAEGRIIHTVPGQTVDIVFQNPDGSHYCRTIADEGDMLFWNVAEKRLTAAPRKTFMERWEEELES